MTYSTPLAVSSEWVAGDPRRRLVGARVALRPIERADAAFLCRLRGDPALNAFLSPAAPTEAAQRAWIDCYKSREDRGEEYYYVIERAEDGAACGTVRLYDFANDSCEWGSFVLAANKPSRAAVEAALLSFGIAFEALGLQRARIAVRRDNMRAIAFYSRFGMTELGGAVGERFFELTRRRFEELRPELTEVIGGAVETML